MNELGELGEKIKILKMARDILQQEYSQSEFHKKKEAHPNSTVPPTPDDGKIYKLLNAIQQLELYFKKLQEEQLELLKEHEDK